MTIRAEVIGILVFGVAVLYVVFGTKWLVDWQRMKAVAPSEVGGAMPYPAIFAIAIGLACVMFGGHFLLFGARTIPAWLQFLWVPFFLLWNAMWRKRYSK